MLGGLFSLCHVYSCLHLSHTFFKFVLCGMCLLVFRGLLVCVMCICFACVTCMLVVCLKCIIFSLRYVDVLVCVVRSACSCVKCTFLILSCVMCFL